MAYEFFFSYTRGNSGQYLQQFFAHLSDELREQMGLPKGTEVGFFDQQEIELGEEWQETILGALQASKVMVCVYSPGYFKSPYCGKEWQFFQMRREAFRRSKAAAGVQPPPLPPTIKPVFWLAPLPTDLDDAVKASQYLWGDPNDEHNREGLKYVLQKFNDYSSLYWNYVKRLATEIREAAAAYDMPQLTPRPPLKAVPSAFVKQVVARTEPQQAASPVHVQDEPRHVRFVFVAGNPNEFGGVRSPAAYVSTGARDWRPFYPQITSRIGRFVQNFVSDEELDFDSSELLLDDNLIQEIEKAYHERKIVIILVDGWSVSWKQEYQQILQRFDRDLKPYIINCSVLVPWNESDTEVADRRDAIVETVRNTFDIRANVWKNPIFYRDSIRSIDELRDALREVLTHIRSEMHKRAERGRSLPSNITKPVVSNQPAKNETGL